MARVDEQPAEARGAPSAPALALWSLVAAFGTYFCMYAFRKPFTAAAFADGTVWGIGEKAVLVTAQVLGYTAAKVAGIRVIAEVRPSRRAAGILLLIGSAQASLLLFGLAPTPWHAACLFLNGLSLGMVFGLVLGFLEGRRSTEALAAGLCASFILADGVAKSVGTWLLDRGIGERWMPAAAGLMFVPPLLGFVAMLAKIPPPDGRDVALRGERPAMDRRDRRRLLRRYGPGLAALVAAYLLVTIVRSVRADFMPELWRGLGVSAAPATFANSELLVALIVLVVNGASVLILDNRRAFFASIGVALAGGLLMIGALAALRWSWIGGFPFMVLLGAGLYLPYVAMHTTIFERLIAMTWERGNLGFLMYVADAAGYLGYATLMIAEGLLPPIGGDFLGFFTALCATVAALAVACLALSWVYFTAHVATGGRGGADR